MATMYVDLWTDVVCPFCYLGWRQLTEAVASFEHGDDVVVRHHAFELDANAPASYEHSLSEMVARKYGMPQAHADALHRRLEAEAAELDMVWRFDDARPGNTFDAHRVIARANAAGLGSEMTERLFRAYFCEGRLVSDRATLVELAEEAGLSGAAELLEGEDLVDAVRADEAAATELGLSGVPAALIDGRFMVVGAQGSSAYAEVLRRAWARRAVA
jgi:predicted DsbA family dithiol-disulfide isomerase